eukprot:CAMPEP_0171105126 /NCGR_PEP_ID=MMETSP0766_2-20121228/62027_1 /TAXON_ID=439317 /ORGANISM="Gambierdiscus australes, Strain CAWD 149" /LENGTH=36 /DNA_ID= /DNA_START= /DNA_END= /DNA_ORIENTATION=
MSSARGALPLILAATACVLSLRCFRSSGASEGAFAA